MKGRIASSPNFWGSNPAEVKQGPRQGLRALAREEDYGRELLMSLTPEQKKTLRRLEAGQIFPLAEPLVYALERGRGRLVAPLWLHDFFLSPENESGSLERQPLTGN